MDFRWDTNYRSLHMSVLCWTFTGLDVNKKEVHCCTWFTWYVMVFPCMILGSSSKWYLAPCVRMVHCHRLFSWFASPKPDLRKLFQSNDNFHPWKWTAGWPENHPIEKENHPNETSFFLVQHVNFPGWNWSEWYPRPSGQVASAESWTSRRHFPLKPWFHTTLGEQWTEGLCKSEWKGFPHDLFWLSHECNTQCGCEFNIP